MNTTQTRMAHDISRTLPQYERGAPQAGSFADDAAIESLGLTSLPERLTDWVPASILAGLALESAKILSWTDGPAVSQEPYDIVAMLAFVTYSSAVGAVSCEEMVTKLACSERNARFLGPIKLRCRQLQIICSQNSELLKNCLARVLERVWLGRYGWANLEKADSVAFLPSISRAKFAAGFRRLFRWEAERRIKHILNMNHLEFIRCCSRVGDGTSSAEPLGESGAQN